MADSLHLNEIPPAGPMQGCVITLHGRGVNGEDLMPLANEIALPGIRWIFPDAPFPFPSDWGGRMWYGFAPEKDEGIVASRRLLFDLLDDLTERQKIPAEKLVLMGFSQGAVMSLDAGLRYPKKLAMIVALSGYLPFPERLAAEKSAASAGLPIILIHGTGDEVVPVDGSRKAQEALLKEGYPVRLREYPMGHEVIPDELRLIRDELKKGLSLPG